MAIAEMSKLRLVGLTAERNGILNALASTGCAELKECPLSENTSFRTDSEATLAVAEKAERVEGCISQLSHAVEGYAHTHDVKVNVDAVFDVPYSRFISIADEEQRLFEVCDKVSQLTSAEGANENEAVRLKARIKALSPYESVADKFSAFKDTRFALVYLGTVPQDKLEGFVQYAGQTDGVECQVLGEGDSVAVLFVAHRQMAEGAEASLTAFGFQRCSFTDERTAGEMIAECQAGLADINAENEKISAELFALGESLNDLKVLADFYAFECEKLVAAEKFPQTQAAFLMEAYVPVEAQNKVSCAIKAVSENIYFEFDGIGEEEMPPTLMKNNKVVKNFEFVTNMYTPPNYREFDPNTVMSVFFAIFLGFIMADIGYGLLMMAIGFFMGFRTKKDTGMRRLMLVIGYSGIFTVIFGLLFGSFFGFAKYPSDMNSVGLSFLPPPLLDTNLNWKLLGQITVPSVLLVSLGMGIVQLMASNACRAWQEFRYGRIADGIFFGLIWVVFLGGMLVMVIGLIDDLNMSSLVMPGAITAGASLLVAACTAGIHERGLGKFTKAFGAVYGIINYLSDILSYARLYGLMLSGAIIAQIASGQGINLVLSGNVALAVVGVLVMIIGHAFNLAMGLLGGYIHDARLQYIEFFSRFYGGEGELFKPLGSRRKYISLM